MKEKREMRSVPSTLSNKHERPGAARARYADIGVIASATNSTVTGTRTCRSTASGGSLFTSAHEFEQRHFGGVARTHARADDPRVAAASVLERRTDLVANLCDHFGLGEVRRNQTARMQIATPGGCDEPLDDLAHLFGLGGCRFDL